KRQQPVKEHEDAVRQLEVVFGSLRKFFQLAHGIVRKEADGSGGERRQSGKVSRFVLAQQVIQNFKGIAFKLLARLTLFQRDVVAASAQHHIRTYAKESVAANFFAALYGFKQEGVGRALGVGRDAQKGGNRGAQVGSDGLGHGNQSGVFGQRGKLLEVGPEHGSPS